MGPFECSLKHISAECREKLARHRPSTVSWTSDEVSFKMLLINDQC